MNSSDIRFGVNDQFIEISLASGAISLATFLRERQHLRGTKIVCAEGDCGACSVLIDRSGDGDYEVVNSCIYPLLLVQGSHVVTIEGLSQKYPDHPLRNQLLQSLGSQCGFCTPGFMVTLSRCYEHHVQEDQRRPATEEDLKLSCSGHLCRCTGYQDILRGALHAINEGEAQRPLALVYESIRSELFNGTKQSYFYEGPGVRYAIPATLAEACRWKDRFPELKIIAGGTDLGVEVNKREDYFHHWMSLKNLPALQRIRQHAHGSIHIGGAVTLTQLRKALRVKHPEFAQFLLTFASPNIRHVGTLIGNLVTASPIGDSLPYLVLQGARVRLVSVLGERELPIEEFITGYRQTALLKNELVKELILPPRVPEAVYELTKISRREHMDISALSLAAWAQVRQGVLGEWACVFGGMSATVTRLPALEKMFTGRPVSDLANTEVDLSAFLTPLSDARGSSQYRLHVAQHLLRRFFQRLHQQELEQAPVGRSL